MEKLNRLIESYPPELKLLLVFCGSERWEAEELLPVVDWDKFLAWVKRHRVTPAVYRYIKKNPVDVPEEVAKTIEQRFEKITKRNLLLAGETIQICKTLENHGIKAIPLKGVFLAKQLYNDYNYRETRDIDILVKPMDVNNSLKILMQKGFSLHESKYNKEFLKSGEVTLLDYPISLKSELKNVTVELHWQLLPWKGLASKLYEQMWDTKHHVSFQGAFVESIDLLKHMEYNVYHGTKHLWSALQWVVDVRHWHSAIKNQSDVMTFENNHCLETSLFLNDLLFNKTTKNINVPDKWVEDFVISISTYNENVFKSFYYKIKYLKLAFWMNRDQKGFWKVYIKYFWLKLFS